MQGYRVKMLSAALVIAATIVACDRKSSRLPTAPTTPTAPSTPTTPAVTITRLELIGPGTVYLGQAVQFTATAHQSDGTTRDVTRDVAWGSFNPSLLAMAAPGQFTGRAKGQTSMRVVAPGGRSATIGEVIIVPEGTFRLSGTVRDSGVLVEAEIRIDDPALGRTDVRASGGRYVVFGVTGDTKVTVTKSGYQEETKRQVLTSHQTIDFDLALARPRTDISGRYTLTISAAPDCRTLPAELVSRSYSAVVAQSGAAITVTLEGTQFFTSGSRTLNRFTGHLEAERAVFRLTPAYDYYYYYFALPDIFEVLGAGSYYGLDGVAEAAIGAGNLSLSGPLSGWIGKVSGPPYRSAGGCRSANHRFVLARGTS